MKNNFPDDENFKKLKTFNQDYLTNELNRKVDSILERTQILDKKKNKNIMNNWEEDNKEYYENFLIKLKAERKKSHINIKSGIKFERKRKSKTFKLNETEKKKINTTLNNNRRKSMMHSFLRKSLLFKKIKEPIIENIKEEKLESVIEKNSFQMSKNIQIFIKETSKKEIKNNLNDKKKNKKKKNSSYNEINDNNIFSSLIIKENPFEKDFKILNNNNRIFTFEKIKINEKKREEITKRIYDQIINPVEKSFISNATKIELKKDKESNSKNNNNENDNKKIEIVNVGTNGNNDYNNNNNVFIYTINENSTKRKKFFCCCVPLKF